MKTLLCLACSLTLGGMVWGEVIPGKATVELIFDKKQYYLGEPCRVEFVLRNTDDKNISYSYGGDSRGANRAMRFRVQAVDANGEIVPEADRDMIILSGGPGGTQSLSSGAIWQETLRPLDYLRLTQPGKYTIRITHDLGWGGREAAWRFSTNDDKPPFVPKEWKAPIGEAQVEFLLPDEQRAEKILDAVEAELQKPNNDASRCVTSPHNLALPVYFPLLQKRAWSEPYFLSAIAEIPTKDVTLALLELAENKDFPHAAVAAFWLSKRMPTPKITFGSQKNVIILGTLGDRKMVETAWDESYVPRARAVARILLERYDPRAEPQEKKALRYYFNNGSSWWPVKDVELGAKILASIGTAEDYKILRDTLTKTVALVSHPRRDTSMIIQDFPAPMPDLILALDALRGRGFELKTSNGWVESFLYFHWLAQTPPPRPAEWLAKAQSASEMWYPVKIAILESIPAPMPPECRELVLKFLDEKDCGVMMQACEVAGESGDKTLLPEVLAIIRVEQNLCLFRTAADAATKLGARRELAEAMAERLTDVKLWHDTLKRLIAFAVENEPHSSDKGMTRHERIAAQAAWRAWIAAHGEEIEAGKKFQPGDDKHLPRALFARAVYWTLPDGKKWPAE